MVKNQKCLSSLASQTPYMRSTTMDTQIVRKFSEDSPLVLLFKRKCNLNLAFSCIVYFMLDSILLHTWLPTYNYYMAVINHLATNERKRTETSILVQWHDHEHSHMITAIWSWSQSCDHDHSHVIMITVMWSWSLVVTMWCPGNTDGSPDIVAIPLHDTN